MCVCVKMAAAAASITASSCDVTSALADWLWKRLRLQTDWIIKNTACVRVWTRCLWNKCVSIESVRTPQRKYGRVRETETAGEAERELKQDQIGRVGR